MGNDQSKPLITDDVRPNTLQERSLEAVANYIKSGQVKRVVVIAGAGISTASGIPDYRSPHSGIFHSVRDRFGVTQPEDIFHLETFRRDPTPFYTLSRELMKTSTKPTYTHFFIAELHRRDLLDMCFTQNIDTLERQAGVPGDRLVEAHGSYATQHCIECKEPFADKKMREALDEGVVPVCGGVGVVGVAPRTNSTGAIRTAADAAAFDAAIDLAAAVGVGGSPAAASGSAPTTTTAASPLSTTSEMAMDIDAAKPSIANNTNGTETSNGNGERNPANPNENKPPSPPCPGFIKPGVVLYGEQLPPTFFNNYQRPRNADLVLVMGTSLEVSPFADLPQLAAENIPRVLFNMKRAGDFGTRPDDVVVRAPVDHSCRALAQMLGWEGEIERHWRESCAKGEEGEAERQVERSDRFLELVASGAVEDSSSSSSEDEDYEYDERVSPGGGGDGGKPDTETAETGPGATCVDAAGFPTSSTT